MDFEVKRKSKKQFILQPLLPFWLPCLPQWKVASGSDYLLVTLPARGSVCQPCREVGSLSLCECSAWKCLSLCPSPLPLSTSLWNLPVSYLGIQGVTPQNQKQPVNLVITKASLASLFHWGGRTRGKGRKGRLWGSCPNFLKIISFSNYPDIICACALATVYFLSGNLRPSSEHLWRVSECKRETALHVDSRGAMTGCNSWWPSKESVTISLLY